MFLTFSPFSLVLLHVPCTNIFLTDLIFPLILNERKSPGELDEKE